MSNNSDLINTLRLGQHELHKLLEEFDRGQAGSDYPDREFVRSSFRVGAIELTVIHSSGSEVTLPVATRNISKGGISLLHSAYIHTGSKCAITLNFPGTKPEIIPGTIVRCQHIKGRVHEIGIKFDYQISTKDLLGLDPLNEAYSLEKVEPDRLHGSALLVSPSELDCQLMLTYLEGTNLELSSATDIVSAVSRAQKGADIIITDYHLDSDTGPQLIAQLRKAGLDMPVIVMTSDKSETALDAIREAEAEGILSKPITKDRLLQALAEFLHADGDGGPLFTTLTQEDAAFPLVGKFLTDVPRMALTLEKAMKEDDEKICYAICRSFSGTASPLGFEPISTIALACEKKLDSGGLKSARTELRTLIIACRRIKSRPAA